MRYKKAARLLERTTNPGLMRIRDAIGQKLAAGVDESEHLPSTVAAFINGAVKRGYLDKQDLRERGWSKRQRKQFLPPAKRWEELGCAVWRQEDVEAAEASPEFTPMRGVGGQRVRPEGMKLATWKSRKRRDKRRMARGDTTPTTPTSPTNPSLALAIATASPEVWARVGNGEYDSMAAAARDAGVFPSDGDATDIGRGSAKLPGVSLPPG